MRRIIFVLLLVIVLASFISACEDGGQINDISKTPTVMSEATPVLQTEDDYDSSIDFYVSPSSGNIRIGIEISEGFYVPIDGGGLEWGYELGD